MNEYWKDAKVEDEAVNIVKEALKTKLWQGTWPEQMNKLQALNDKMSEFYEVKKCTLQLQPGIASPCYQPAEHKILLNRPSLVSWAHEFAHHLLHSRFMEQCETFPRAFSLGLFHKAAPRLFETARQRKRLMFTE